MSSGGSNKRKGAPEPSGGQPGRYQCRGHAVEGEEAAAGEEEGDESEGELEGEGQYDQKDIFAGYAIELLDEVYGENPYSPEFPLPLRSPEAGPCRSGQRRYLWTDAFAVMAYKSLSEHYAKKEELQLSRMYLHAAEKLISEVHEGLGKPRNSNAKGMKQCDISPTGYVGLRAGKPTAKKQTDPGSRYDGQYWHHIDKWLFALERCNHIKDGVRIAKSVFPYFFRDPVRCEWDEKHFRDRGGMTYKISVDTTPAACGYCCSPGAQSYDDTLSALVVYSMLEAKNEHKERISLGEEIKKLEKTMLRYSNVDNVYLRYKELGNGDQQIEWGVAAIFDQFVVGHPRRNRYGFCETGKHSLSWHEHTNLQKNWRLYGALMGAITDGTIFSQASLDELLKACVGHQSVRYNPICSILLEGDRKAGMERVMLAMALLSPGVLKRRDNDVMVQGGSIYWPYNKKGEWIGHSGN